MNKYWFDYYITFLVISLHCKNSDIYSKDRQLWLPELYRKKYGSNILGFTAWI